MGGRNYKVENDQEATMGLDWNPANRPKEGFEEEFEKVVQKLNKGVLWGEKNLKKRFHEISIPAFETLQAPTVGRDAEADKWLRKKYEESDKSISFEDLSAKYAGYKVFDLVKNCPGIPWYSNGGMGYVESYSFRAQFLIDCEFIIGKELLDQAYEFMFPTQLAEYGKKLLVKAQSYARSQNLDIPDSPIDDDTKPEFHLHVVKSAGEWAIFWAERRHSLEPYF